MGASRTNKSSSHYGGLFLGGGKSHSTAFAILDHDLSSNKLILSELFGKLGSTKSQSADETLLHVIHKRSYQLNFLGVNVPLSFPACITCKESVCPGHESCSVETVKWMRECHQRIRLQHKHAKYPLPYMQRSVELYLQERFGRQIEIPGAYSSNSAPLTSRISYLRRQINPEIQLIEVLPKLTFLLLSKQLFLPTERADTYRGPEKGSQDRFFFLEALIKSNQLFIYSRDLELLTLHPHCFDAFLVAYTAYLFDVGKCEEPSKDLPTDSGWVTIPIT